MSRPSTHSRWTHQDERTSTAGVYKTPEVLGNVSKWGAAMTTSSARFWWTGMIAVALFAAAQADGKDPRTSAPVPLRAGSWRAWLDSPGGELPFGLELAKETDHWQAWIINGDERIEVPRVAFTAGELVLHIDYYDSTITARPMDNGARLAGEWVKRSRGESRTRMKFHATAGQARRFPPWSSVSGKVIMNSAAGRWSVDFSSSDEPAVAVFEQYPDGRLAGTFLTSTGDYRFLAGNVDRNGLRLSCFDGAHAFLFHARMRQDGRLLGDFWSRDTWHETWTARRDPNAALPDSFTLTRWLDRVKLGSLSFPDLDGRVRSLSDPDFVGRVRIIEIFGTWCPNCNDATQYLIELNRKYRDRGLKILALAFELTGNAKRDADQVRTYIKRHGIEYPVLLAGTSDKKAASDALPILDRLRAYPTTIFLDRHGKVRAVHTGFSGPATGDAYKKLRADFERLIEELLAESSR